MMKLRLTRFSLILSLLFTGFSAIVLGVDFILYPNGTLVRLHPVMLANSPFSNFLMPGVISLVLIGGSCLAAFVLLLEKNIYALAAVLVCGIVIICWMSLIALLIREVFWINILYWIIGFKIIVEAFYIQREYDSISIR